MTYTPQVGDRVMWCGDCGPYTITAIGKQRAMVATDGGIEIAANITNLTPIPDTVTIEISREDAEELVRVVEERDDLMSWVLVGSWTFTSELRLKDTLQAALAGEK